MEAHTFYFEPTDKDISIHSIPNEDLLHRVLNIVLGIGTITVRSNPTPERSRGKKPRSGDVQKAHPGAGRARKGEARYVTEGQTGSAEELCER